MVTGTDFDVNVSMSTCSDVGGLMSSMLGSGLVIDMGMAYVPARFTAAQSTFASSTAGLNASRVF
jgi:hypothetical protein